jgi:hypothetical protein
MHVATPYPHTRWDAPVRPSLPCATAAVVGKGLAAAAAAAAVAMEVGARPKGRACLRKGTPQRQRQRRPFVPYRCPLPVGPLGDPAYTMTENQFCLKEKEENSYFVGAIWLRRSVRRHARSGVANGSPPLSARHTLSVSPRKCPFDHHFSTCTYLVLVSHPGGCGALRRGPRPFLGRPDPPRAGRSLILQRTIETRGGFPSVKRRQRVRQEQRESPQEGRHALSVCPVDERYTHCGPVALYTWTDPYLGTGAPRGIGEQKQRPAGGPAARVNPPIRCGTALAISRGGWLLPAAPLPPWTTTRRRKRTCQ